jgi:hypothetical protein
VRELEKSLVCKRLEIRRHTTAPIPHPYFLQTATGHVVMFGTFTECANAAIAYTDRQDDALPTCL